MNKDELKIQLKKYFGFATFKGLQESVILNVLKKECFNTINTLIENYISVLPRMSEPLLEPHYHELTQLLIARKLNLIPQNVSLK